MDDLPNNSLKCLNSARLHMGFAEEALGQHNVEEYNKHIDEAQRYFELAKMYDSVDTLEAHGIMNTTNPKGDDIVENPNVFSGEAHMTSLEKSRARRKGRRWTKECPQCAGDGCSHCGGKGYH